MNDSPKLSGPHFEIVRMLTSSVRVLSARQAQKVAGDTSREQTSKRLRRLRDKGLLQLRSAWACSPAITDAPLFRWEPHSESPDCPKLARLAYSRWSAPKQPMKVVVATEKARNLYGTVKIREPRESELAHDLWVTELFVNRYAEHPVYSWLHEDGFGELFPEGNRPDAALRCDDTGSKAIAIELLGNYRASKIEQFHNYCQEHEISYEIW